MENLIALVALTSMEIVLGIDNIVFLTIVTGRLPESQQPKAQRLGLILAMVFRILLLSLLSFVMKADEPLVEWTDFGIPAGWLPADPEAFHEVNGISVKDLILLGGGLFLIWKSVHEIHEKIGDGTEKHQVSKKVTFTSALVQIVLLDIIFSLDSVITAVGMARALWVMITAVILAIAVMLIFAEAISRFVNRNPTLKMLALSFLILIGVTLVAEGVGTPLDKGYIYFAMAFALLVEVLNLRTRKQPATPAAANG